MRETLMSYAPDAPRRNPLRAALRFALPVAAMFLAGCSSFGMGDFARTAAVSGPATSPVPVKVSLSVVDSVDPSDWETVRRTIASIPANTTGRYGWSNPRTHSSGTLTVLPLASGSSASCRAIATTINDMRGIRSYRGEACHRRDGQWQLFGLRPDDTKLL